MASRRDAISRENRNAPLAHITSPDRLRGRRGARERRRTDRTFERYNNGTVNNVTNPRQKQRALSRQRSMENNYKRMQGYYERIYNSRRDSDSNQPNGGLITNS